MRTPALIQKVRRTVARFGLLAPGDRVLVAVSGGPDSVALLEVLFRLREELGLALAVAHYDHRLRPESGEEALFVRREAARRGLPFVQGAGPVRPFARHRGLSLEAAARARRYAFLRRAARRLGANRIALGHQADDLAEEVLLRFLRGAGRRGLAGIPVKREGVFVRPLLLCSRAEVEDFLREEGLAFVEDPSNRDLRFTRNRVRHLLLPFLEEHFHPGVRECLRRTALILAEEEEFLGDLTRGTLEGLLVRAWGRPGLDVPGLSSLPLALRRRVCLEFLKRAGVPLHRVSLAHLEQIESLVTGRPRGPVSLPGGFLARREGGRLVVGRRLPEETFSLEIEAPGTYPLPRGLALRVEEAQGPPPAGATAVDPSRAPFPWRLRPPRPGDRLRPPGLGGRKKCKKIFQERGVPHDLRRLWPVIEKEGRLVALPGLAVDQDFVPREPGGRCLLVSLLLEGEAVANRGGEDLNGA